MPTHGFAKHASCFLHCQLSSTAHTHQGGSSTAHPRSSSQELTKDSTVACKSCDCRKDRCSCNPSGLKYVAHCCTALQQQHETREKRNKKNIICCSLQQQREEDRRAAADQSGHVSVISGGAEAALHILVC